MTTFIPQTPADVLGRCRISLLKAADWVEEGDGAEAVSMIHLVVDDLERLLATPEMQEPGFTGLKAPAKDNRHVESYQPPNTATAV